MSDVVLINGKLADIPTDLQRWSFGNWMKIPADVRAECIDLLRERVPKEVVEEWKTDFKAGHSIGHKDIRFHFSVAMAVRNTLREVLLDNMLPPIEQRHLPRTLWGWGWYLKARNWDDFYQGALLDFVEQELAKEQATG